MCADRIKPLKFLLCISASSYRFLSASFRYTWNDDAIYAEVQHKNIQFLGNDYHNPISFVALLITKTLENTISGKLKWILMADF